MSRRPIDFEVIYPDGAIGRVDVYTYEQFIERCHQEDIPTDLPGSKIHREWVRWVPAPEGDEVRRWLREAEPGARGAFEAWVLER